MLKRFLVPMLIAGPLAAAGLAQTVTVSLTSSEDGMTVSPGATINWQIAFTTSTGDNAGLALLIADLEQDAGNPGTLDIPPAGSVPGAMANFSRPAGISNPGELNPATGYVGVQRGTMGALNLVQIGGGQNTFGVAQPGGTGIAENANVVGGVGQSGSVVLASGSFAAPATDGDYTFNMTNVIANVVDTLNTPPAFSPVVAASVATGSNSFSFTVSAGGGCSAACMGADVDGDCDVDLTDLGVLLGDFGCTGGCAGDTDNDGDTDLTDLGVLLGSFGAVCP